jgi:hypothetical protein
VLFITLVGGGGSSALVLNSLQVGFAAGGNGNGASSISSVSSNGMGGGGGSNVGGIAGAAGAPGLSFTSLTPGSAGGSLAGGDGGTAVHTDFGTSGTAGKGNQALGGAVSISHAAHCISGSNAQDLISCLSAMNYLSLLLVLPLF